MRGLAGGVLVLVLAALLVAAPSASAFGILDGDTGFRGVVFSSEDEDEGHSFIVDGTGIYDQAGGHPYKGIVDFILTGTTADNVENLRVDTPPGLVPNPEHAARCSDAQMALSLCPSAAQIGMEELTIALSSVPGAQATLRLPLYNMEISAGQVSRFAFNPADAAGVPGTGLVLSALGLHQVDIVGGVRDSADIANPDGTGAFPFAADNGLFFTIDDIPPATAVIRSKLTFWGVPGAPAHAPLAPGPSLTPTPTIGQSCITGLSDAVLGGLGIPLGLPLCVNRAPILPLPPPQLPFLSNPTSCTGAKLAGRLIVDANEPDQPGSTASRIDQTPTLPNAQGVPVEGTQQCELVPVDGGIEVEPDVTVPDSPSGPSVAVTVPQPGLTDKDVLATAHVRDIAVTLPPGMTINPSAANGLLACTDAQLAAGAGSPGADACPEESDIGDVTVSTPLLPDALGGNAYVGEPLAGDQYRLFVTVEGRGVSIRLKGSVRPDPGSGQVTAIFEDNPELPFDELSVDFEDGPRAVLATPADCGSQTAAARLTPWSGAAAIDRASSPFEIAGAGCPVGFQPAFAASTASSASGAFSPFTARIGRDDGNQFLSGVRVDTPPGLAAKIKGVEQCSDAAANAGACPAATRIGTATTTAGAGSEPYRLSGPVYFTEGYRGASFGMVAVIRAIAGPYDLGTVVVRQAIFVDPEDAHLTVVSDPLPRILEGVPIRLRSIDVTLDRSGFTYNPTSCGAKAVGGRLHSVQGTAVDRSAGIQFDDCQRLGFAPRTRMRLTGPRQLRLGGHPGLRVQVTQPGGQANIAKAVVKLPRSLALDPGNAQAVCGYEAGLRADCPRKTRIGWATAVSPVLNRKLAGPVYFVQGIRIDPTTGNRIRTLPSLLAKLNGEVRINLRGTTDVDDRDRLVSTFASVPDAPVSRFDVRLKGGKGGVLAATGRPRICGRRQIGLNGLVGHNGKRASQRRLRIRTAAPCRKLRRLQAKAKQRKAAQRRRAASRRAAS